MNLIKLNGKIEIISEDGRVTEGMVVDKSESSVDFSVPADDKNFKLFHKGECIRAVAYGERKAVLFNGIIGLRKSENIPSYSIIHIGGIKEIQRRDNVRVPCSAPIQYTNNRYLIESVASVNNLDHLIERIAKYMKSAIMIDLSAGGVKFSCDEDIKEGQKILLQICLEEEPLVIHGIVVHRQLIVNPANIKYFYGIKFENLDESTEELIINHVFILMRKQSRK
ncbi:flagellar brake protein [Alkalibacter mobilis]|uniref:flagellar brake protein n=1 Tax=Alkalibacter mobilis TaxID=2787712 RepID=UPI00189EE22C|nr:PilZ domain-containing protein [Alkalibacter mobilis]MBF7096303.1 PilZ domain-containing protein [Alkalibacter mobilis]